MSMTTDRRSLERQLVSDIREISAGANRLERVFSGIHQISNNDLDALRQIVVAELAGKPLSSGELRTQLGVSAAAVTYLVDRMIESGHLRRESDPTDRRRVILRYSDHGMGVAQDFFRPMRAHTHAAMAGISDEQLATAHHVLVSMMEAMESYYRELAAENR